jgi:beta-glucanase (GH16 family)
MRISVRIKLPDVMGEAAIGYWPAFWTMGDKFREGYKGCKQRRSTDCE